MFFLRYMNRLQVEYDETEFHPKSPKWIDIFIQVSRLRMQNFSVEIYWYKDVEMSSEIIHFPLDTFYYHIVN